MKKGFLKTIILVIIALALLKIVFNIDVIDWLRDNNILDFLKKIWDFIVEIWNRFFEPVFAYGWNMIKAMSLKSWEIIEPILQKMGDFFRDLNSSGTTPPDSL